MYKWNKKYFFKFAIAIFIPTLFLVGIGCNKQQTPNENVRIEKLQTEINVLQKKLEEKPKEDIKQEIPKTTSSTNNLVIKKPTIVPVTKQPTQPSIQLVQDSQLAIEKCRLGAVEARNNKEATLKQQVILAFAPILLDIDNQYNAKMVERNILIDRRFNHYDPSDDQRALDSQLATVKTELEVLQNKKTYVQNAKLSAYTLAEKQAMDIYNEEYSRCINAL